MKVIGLTGNIGCGKSTVAGMLRELGVATIDADAVAREIRHNDADARAAIQRRFGTYDAAELASVVFTATGDITDTAQTMVLRLNGSPLSSTSTCTKLLATNTTVTCTLTTPLAFTAFDGLALTVVSQ